jgi:hypothetical protein
MTSHTASGTFHNMGAMVPQSAAISVKDGGTAMNSGTRLVIYGGCDGIAIQVTGTAVTAVTNSSTIAPGTVVRSRSRRMHIRLRHHTIQELGGAR